MPNTSTPRSKFRAICHDDGFVGRWRDSMSEALSDVQDHLQDHPGHDTDIEVNQSFALGMRINSQATPRQTVGRKNLSFTPNITAMPDNGRLIFKTEVEPIMDKFLSIFGRAKEKILSTPPVDEDLKTFYSSNYNGFVFSKAMVERFFDGSMGDTAEDLLVVLGAHPESDTAASFTEGQSTIILIGCKTDPSTGKYVSLNHDQPAVEHPPMVILVDPPLVEGGPLHFTVGGSQAKLGDESAK